MDKNQLKKLYLDEGWSTIKIAEFLNCSPQTVANRLASYDIPLKGKGSYKGPKSPEHTQKLIELVTRLHKGVFGENHPAWKGGRYIDSYGYVVVRVNGKSIKEHRHVMQRYLGRTLEPWDEVNHINGIKTDNSLKNLEVIPNEHKRRDWIRRNGHKNKS